ncbi:MAG: hypothetical protein IT561_22390 [Alphaproteobacteria bacterium]|nr:hypothetical protein [Alphaproteobacteria bacterium]
MMRNIAMAIVAFAFAGSAAQAATDCAGRMAEVKPMMAKVTDAKMKDGLTARWGQAEAAMTAKNEKGCLDHLAFIEKAIKDGKM